MARSLFTLFLFVTWLLPMFAGAMLASARAPNWLFQSVSSFSPIVGVTTSSEFLGTQNRETLRIEAIRLEMTNGDAIRFAALVPTLVAACTFHFLGIGVQRRIDRAIIEVLRKRSPDPDFSPDQAFKATQPADAADLAIASQSRTSRSPSANVGKGGADVPPSIDPAVDSQIQLLEGVGEALGVAARVVGRLGGLGGEEGRVAEQDARWAGRGGRSTGSPAARCPRPATPSVPATSSVRRFFRPADHCETW